MPAQNYVLLERVEVGETAVSSITFNSIPQTGYTDLKVVVSGREVTGTSLLFTMRINGLTTNQSTREIRGSGSAATSGTNTIATIDQNGSGTTASTFGNAEIYIPNYTSANFKSISIDSASENNATAAYMRLSAGLWSQTAAITSLSFFPSSGTIAQYSSFSLYGLAAVGTTPTRAPKATGGSIIQTDGTYWYHAFLASGTFTPAVGLSCDVLVVAGGGGGGGYYAGRGAGGGAGGLLGLTSQSLIIGNYSVVIGAGGTGTNGSTIGAGTQGTNGVNSTVGALTAAVGGGLGGGEGGSTGTFPRTGANGGSGGGGSSGATSAAGGTATSGQGFAGAAGQAGAGGGGGAGAIGGTGTSTSAGGVGGIGLNTYSSYASATSTGVSGYYAGGGAGGGGTPAGGTGGGGAADTAGTANTGGGGGGGGGASVGKSGGSGIVIIRYAV